MLRFCKFICKSTQLLDKNRSKYGKSIRKMFSGMQNSTSIDHLHIVLNLHLLYLVYYSNY